MGKIKNLPVEERPREKALKYGIEHLSDVELLAIVINSGTKKESALDIAHKIIYENSGLKNLNELSINDLCSFEGISSANALKIKACFELAERQYKIINSKDNYLIDPLKIVKKYKNEMFSEEKEFFLLISLNKNNRIIKEKLFEVGSNDEVRIKLVDIFRTLIESKARKFYIFHNHTSGNSSPSEIDCFITASLISSADKIGIKLVDHIIVGREMYYSFAIKANRYL